MATDRGFFFGGESPELALFIAALKLRHGRVATARAGRVPNAHNNKAPGGGALWQMGGWYENYALGLLHDYFLSVSAPFLRVLARHEPPAQAAAIRTSPAPAPQAVCAGPP